MKIRKLSDFFSIGYNATVLTRLDSRRDSLADCLQIVSDLARQLSNEGFKVSERLFKNKVMGYADLIVQNHLKTDPQQSNFKKQSLEQKDVEEIEQRMRQVAEAMMAELEDIPVFSMLEKRYSYEKLNSNVAALFGKDVFDKLNEIARFDFSESAKCILFERSTAAAFHCLRATESVLKDYYKTTLGKLPSDNATWGGMEKDLLLHKPVIDASISNQITHLRTRYRNQTQHPRLRYETDEAQDLFNLCIELVNHIA